MYIHLGGGGNMDYITQTGVCILLGPKHLLFSDTVFFVVFNTYFVKSLSNMKKNPHIYSSVHVSVCGPQLNAKFHTHKLNHF